MGTKQKTTPELVARQQQKYPEFLQRKLFELAGCKFSNRLGEAYTNLLQGYDCIPFTDLNVRERYLYDLSADEQVRTREFKLNPKAEHIINPNGLGDTYTISAQAAVIAVKQTLRITDEKGKEHTTIKYDKNNKPIYKKAHVFPGVREEKVEFALRKIAIERGLRKNGSGRYGVNFTLSGLQRELEETGCTLSLDEIKEAIQVLNKNVVEVSTQASGTIVMSSSRLPDMYLVDRNRMNTARCNGEEVWCYVSFHPMVMAGIETFGYRLTNYTRHNRINNVIARWLHIQLCLWYTWASADSDPYEISLKETFSAIGKESKQPNIDARDMRAAITELVKVGIIHEFKPTLHQVRIIDESDRRKTVDYLYLLTPSEFFIADMRKSNAHQSMLQQSVREFLENVEHQSLSESPTNEPDNALITELETIDYTTKQAHALLKRYGKEYLSGLLTYMKKRSQQIHSKRKYFESLLDRNVILSTADNSDLLTNAEVASKWGFTVNSEEYQFLEDVWNYMTDGDRSTVLGWGFSSPHIQELFKQWQKNRSDKGSRGRTPKNDKSEIVTMTDRYPPQ